MSDADHVDVSGGNAIGIDISLVLGGGIAGTVTDGSTGEGIPSIELWVNRLDNDGLWWGATTDSNGDYLVNGLSPGEYVVQAYDHQEIYVYEFHQDTLFWEDASPVNIIARSNISDPYATPVDFVLDEGGAIEGVVYDDANQNGIQDAGEPGLEGAGVHLEEFDDPWRYFIGGSTEAGGIFRIGGLPPDFDFRVSVDAWSLNFLGGFYDGDDSPTNDWESAARVSVAAGDTLTGLNLGLGEGGTIEGHVYDGDGQPIDGMWVNVGSPGWGDGTSTDSNGYYVIPGTAPGRLRHQYRRRPVP